MKQFKILHPLNGAMNHNCDRDAYEYEVIHSIRCYNIDVAYMQSQNDFNNEYASLGKRSTSVGDIIYDVTADKFYFVAGLGFTEVPKYVSKSKHSVELHGDMAQEFNDSFEEEYYNGDESDNFLQ